MIFLIYSFFIFPKTCLDMLATASPGIFKWINLKDMLTRIFFALSCFLGGRALYATCRTSDSSSESDESKKLLLVTTLLAFYKSYHFSFRITPVTYIDIRLQNVHPKCHIWHQFLIFFHLYRQMPTKLTP